MPLLPRAAILALILILAPLPIAAQDLHGSVHDSASGRPIASAVLVLMDEAGAPRGRTITNDLGQYHIGLSVDTRRVRVLRLGYRARELPLVPPVAGAFDIRLIAIPALLEKVTVQAAGACPRRDDAQSALALLDQARAGLLATIVAAEQNPGTMKLLRYERTMDGTSDRIERQTVHIDSVARRQKSFEASTSAATFVSAGFARDSAGSRILYGPDAEVLLDDSFANAYCFRLVDPDRARPHQVGLGFSAADSRRGRVDIDGAVWIDTVARQLIDIDFRYDGLRQPYNAPHPGGHIHFHEMPNGMVVIQSWALFLASARTDTTGDFRNRKIWTRYARSDVGGEVARAIWPDGRAWKAPLGTVQLHVVTGDGEPTNRVAVRLGEANYIASPDAHGNLEIPDVLPGPYDVFVIDTSVAASGTMLGSGLRIFAQRDSTIRAVVVSPPLEAFQRRRCSALSFGWVTANVLHDDDSPVEQARWEAGEEFNKASEYVFAKGQTGATGVFGFCSDLATSGALQLRVSDGLEPREVVVVNVSSTADHVKITLPARRAPARPR
ncbi:MAG: carboxypeptidase-like regulatory domain-containing protein [Gemmatimonadota bacterium]|nr:carboxypeptidase-like regulatory domain-containing protein [Gemmatimonadota bacterium]